MNKNNEGLLRGMFHFKRSLDGSLKKTKVICTVCKAECNYHRRNSSLTNHLKAKHPTETISTGPRQSILQECGAHGWITKLVSKKVTNDLFNWIV